MGLLLQGKAAGCCPMRQGGSATGSVSAGLPLNGVNCVSFRRGSVARCDCRRTEVIQTFVDMNLVVVVVMVVVAVFCCSFAKGDQSKKFNTGHYPRPSIRLTSTTKISPPSPPPQSTCTHTKTSQNMAPPLRLIGHWLTKASKK